MKESSLKFYFMFEESITSAGFCSVCRETKGKCSGGGSADKGACRLHLYSWCLEWERSPQDALAPVCEGVDGLMKMSRFSCQIVWHLSSAPTVWDSGVGALVWRAALCDWQRGPVSVTEEESTSIFCFDRLQRGLDSLIQSFVWLKVLEPMGTQIDTTVKITSMLEKSSISSWAVLGKRNLISCLCVILRASTTSSIWILITRKNLSTGWTQPGRVVERSTGCAWTGATWRYRGPPALTVPRSAS